MRWGGKQADTAGDAEAALSCYCPGPERGSSRIFWSGLVCRGLVMGGVHISRLPAWIVPVGFIVLGWCSLDFFLSSREREK